jgi:hypothetical protein
MAVSILPMLLRGEGGSNERGSISKGDLFGVDFVNILILRRRATPLGYGAG